MTENLKGKMGHKINHFNVGKGHPIEEVSFTLYLLPTPSSNEIGAFE